MLSAICWPTCIPTSCPKCDICFLSLLLLAPLLSPSSDGESPNNHRHLVIANVCCGSHDVPQPAHGDVRLHADAGWRGAGCAQRLLPGHLGHAGVPRTGPRLRWDAEQHRLTTSTWMSLCLISNKKCKSLPICFSLRKVLSLRCSSQHLQAQCRSPSQRCNYTQYGKICILQVKLSYSLCNQHATWPH